MSIEDDDRFDDLDYAADYWENERFGGPGSMHRLLYERSALNGGPVDLEGRPVKKTKISNPYNYDGFVLHRLGPNGDIDGCSYTDRIFQWDRDKAQRCAEEHMDDRRWDMVRPEQIQAFLRAFFDDPEIRLIAVMEWCNQATGYPTWSLHYKSGKKEESGVKG